MDANYMILLAAAAAALLMCWHLLVRRQQEQQQLTVPVVPGLPLLGNVVALRRGGVAFITKCRQRFGDAFCLQLLGQRMVFVFDPAVISLFLKAPESIVSFKPAVEQFTQRVYGLPSQQFFAVHEDLLSTLRCLLVPDKLLTLGRQLIKLAQPQLAAWQQAGQVELWSGCQRLVFGAAGQVLFGEAFFQRHGLDTLLSAFLTFEGHFEVAASPVPHLLLPQFRASRAALLRMFKQSLAAGDFQGTVVEQLLQGCGLQERLHANLLLAVMWASQANSMAAMFWSLALLLLPEQEGCRSSIHQELSQAVQEQVASGTNSPPSRVPAAMLRLALDRRSTSSRCVAEAIRLRVHSIAVRFVSADTLVLAPGGSRPGAQQQAGDAGGGASDAHASRHQCRQGLQVPRGTVLAICPFESHHDARLFANAWQFQPERPAAGPAGLEPGAVVPGIAGLGFGGGFWRCPGRFFAEMELALLVQLVQWQLPGLRLRVPDQQAPPGQRPAAQSCWPWEALEFGLGGSERQRQQWCRSADLSGLLPECDLQRLVGFKVPRGSCWVEVPAAASL